MALAAGVKLCTARAAGAQHPSAVRCPRPAPITPCRRVTPTHTRGPLQAKHHMPGKKKRGANLTGMTRERRQRIARHAPTRADTCAMSSAASISPVLSLRSATREQEARSESSAAVQDEVDDWEQREQQQKEAWAKAGRRHVELRLEREQKEEEKREREQEEKEEKEEQEQALREQEHEQEEEWEREQMGRGGRGNVRTHRLRSAHRTARYVAWRAWRDGDGPVSF